MRILLIITSIIFLNQSFLNQALAQQCGGQTTYASNSEFIVPVADNEIKIMSYNVENLFDTKHDQGRDDYEFLYLNDPEKANCEQKQGYYKQVCKTLDWTNEKLLIKLNQIRNVVALQGALPDIMAIEEVENGEMVSLLASTLGYEFYTHSTGSDNRIELGLMFSEKKLIFKEGIELIVEFPNGGAKRTRNILVAHFALRSNPSQILAVYVNHWPSQGSPSIARVQAALTFRQGVDYFTAQYGAENYHVVAMGDFNTVDSDNPHPFQSVIFDPSWSNVLYDASYIYYSQGYKADPQQMQNKMPPGTYYYGKDRQWNQLDHIFLSRNLLDNQGVDADQSSYRVLAADFMLTRYEDQKKNYCYDGVPFRYNHNESNPHAAGFSDHFPVLLKIKL